MQMERWHEDHDGVLNESAMCDKMERKGFAVQCYSYPAGTYFPPHTHGVDKWDGVIAGRFRMVMGEREVILEAGDMLFVPKGACHSAEVVGDEPVVSLDAVRR
ncbi:MAG: cupin domain-containing protein [Mariprofundaceae bacterium]